MVLPPDRVGSQARRTQLPIGLASAAGAGRRAGWTRRPGPAADRGPAAAGSSASAGYVKRICVGLQDADGDPRILNDALITSAPGTVRRCEVYVYGVYTDVVSDPEQVINALPDGVETGVSLRPVYGEAPVHPA